MGSKIDSINNLFIPQEDLAGLPEGELQHNSNIKSLNIQETTQFKIKEL